MTSIREEGDDVDRGDLEQGSEGEGIGQEVSLPQKKYYRQRAHSNPLNDHSFD